MMFNIVVLPKKIVDQHSVMVKKTIVLLVWLHPSCTTINLLHRLSTLWFTPAKTTSTKLIHSLSPTYSTATDSSYKNVDGLFDVPFAAAYQAQLLGTKRTRGRKNNNAGTISSMGRRTTARSQHLGRISSNKARTRASSTSLLQKLAAASRASTSAAKEQVRERLENQRASTGTSTLEMKMKNTELEKLKGVDCSPVPGSSAWVPDSVSRDIQQAIRHSKCWCLDQQNGSESSNQRQLAFRNVKYCTADGYFQESGTFSTAGCTTSEQQVGSIESYNYFQTAPTSFSPGQQDYESYDLFVVGDVQFGYKSTFKGFEVLPGSSYATQQASERDFFHSDTVQGAVTQGVMACKANRAGCQWHDEAHNLPADDGGGLVDLPGTTALPPGNYARQDVVVVGDLTHLGTQPQIEEYFSKFLHQFNPRKDWYVLPLLGNHDYEVTYGYLYEQAQVGRLWCGNGRAMGQLQYIRTLVSTADRDPASGDTQSGFAASNRFPVSKRAATKSAEQFGTASDTFRKNSVIDAFHRESGSYAWTHPHDNGRFRMFALHMHPAYEGTCAQRGRGADCFRSPSQWSTYGVEACDGRTGDSLYHYTNTAHCRTLNGLRHSVDWLREELRKTCGDPEWQASSPNGSRYAVLFLHIFTRGAAHKGMTHEVINDLVDDSCVIAVVNGHMHGNVGWPNRHVWKSRNKWNEDVPFLFSGSPALNTWLRMEFRGRLSPTEEDAGAGTLSNDQTGCFWRYQAMFDTHPIETEDAGHPKWGVYRLPDCRTTTTTPAPVDCVLSDWAGDVSSCSPTCGPGTYTQTRSVVTPAVGAGVPCSTERSRLRNCELSACPVDCVLSEWAGDVKECSVSCGGIGQYQQERTIEVHPVGTGQTCDAQRTRWEDCNLGVLCPVDCVLSDWVDSSGACSVTCGAGMRTTRTREIISADTGAGRPCDEFTLEEQTPCDAETTCPITSTTTDSPPPAGGEQEDLDCVMSEWAPFDPVADCTVTCGSGHYVKRRSISVSPTGNGKSCEAKEVVEECNLEACPVVNTSITGGANTTGNTIPSPDIDCVVSSWEGDAEKDCSVTCGEGSYEQTRRVLIEQSGAGMPCGPLHWTQVCRLEACVGSEEPPVSVAPEMGGTSGKNATTSTSSTTSSMGAPPGFVCC
ncbi:unnamed protein product [Amoebophrya sp. A120]|nr:unnamed protein product [Amoebophrya sp. A120]|eukprot:GSA120T00013440001.1